ncbi:low molecular weight phosphotyrosine protein phosphatase [Halosquirtibacter laminarini]|uniref:Low molecular weight phosphotyrosine protein phosphatase n=1 Tax=Halosquirtibacter laminarini TaxID=3374600 RepID=A0AC61NGU7_9BACT|nr:low molecular weight phosphotyrosine protein phosphatase [Prolixibacteraceae bacterium]
MSTQENKTKVLFICLGNICRSAAAEGIFKKYAEDAGMLDQFEIDSAGMISAHEGEKADRRMRKHSEMRGYVLESISRPFDKDVDFDSADYIVAMDGSNILDLKSRARDEADLKKIHRMTDFVVEYDYDTVPDPYTGGPDGFEMVLDILEDSCKGLLDKLKK